MTIMKIWIFVAVNLTILYLILGYSLRHECDPISCDFYGVCHSEETKVYCDCLNQYRQNTTCRQDVDLCKEPLLGTCYPEGTVQCSHYFGYMKCDCKSYKYSGRLCSVRDRSVHKSLGMPMVYLTLSDSFEFATYLPNLTQVYRLMVVYTKRWEVGKIDLYAGGYLTEHTLVESKTDPVPRELLTNFPPIAQTLYIESSRIFRHAGLKNITVIANLGVLHERYDFQVYPIRAMNTCEPIVRFAGGPCSSINYANVRLPRELEFRMRTYSVPMCLDKETNNKKLLTLDFYRVNDESDKLLMSVEPFTDLWFKSHLVNHERFAITVHAHGENMSESYDTCWFDNGPWKHFYVKGLPRKVVLNADKAFDIRAAVTEAIPTDNTRFNYSWSCDVVEFTPQPDDFDEIGSPCTWHFNDSKTSELKAITWHNEGEFTLTLKIKKYNDTKLLNIYTLPVTIVTTYHENVYDLKITCVHNCGDGHMYSIDAVDRTRVIILDADCTFLEHQCTPEIQFKWDILELMVQDANLSEIFSKKRLIIPANTLPNENSFVVSLAVKGHIGGAEYYLCTRTPMIYSHNHNRSVCHYSYYGKQYTTLIDRIDLCLNINHDDYPLIYQFYYHVSSLPKRLGIMVGQGVTPYIADVLLPSSESLGKLTVVVLTETFVQSQYEDNIHIISPMSNGAHLDDKIAFIKEIVEGKHDKWHRMSIEYSVKNGEMSEAIQKFYFVFNELRKLQVPATKADVETIIELKKNVSDTLCGSLQNFKFDSIIDCMQFYSLVEAYLLIIEHPLSDYQVRQIGNVLQTLIARIQVKVEELLEDRRLWIINAVAIPLLEGITSLSDSTFVNKDLLEQDPLDRLVQLETKDEIEFISDYNMHREFNPFFSLENLYNTDSKYFNRTKPILKCYKNVLDIMGFVAECEEMGHFVSYPYIYVDSSKMEFPTGYVYIEMANVTALIDKKVSVDKICWVKISRIHSDGFVTMHLLATDGLILWGQFRDVPYLPKFQVLLYLRPAQNMHDSVDFSAKIYFFMHDFAQLACISSTAAKFVKRVADITTYAVSYVNLHSLVVDFHVPGLYEIIQVVVTVNRPPTIMDFGSTTKKLFFGNVTDKKRILVKITRPNDRNVVYIAVLPIDKTVNFKMCAYTFSCVSSQYDNSTNRYYTPKIDDDVYCPVNATSDLVTYVSLPKRIFAIGFVGVLINYNRYPCFIVYIFWICVLFIFFFMFVYAWRKDVHDTNAQKAHYLVDNRTDETYRYVIIVITGPYPKAGTTSRVGIKLYGDRANSKRHVLRSVVPGERTFQRSSLNMFTLTTKECLGRIAAVEMWLDHRGHSPSWYCEKLIVRDYWRKREWVFMARRWFSFIYGVKKVHQIVYQTSVKHETMHRKIFSLEYLYVNHKWFTMLIHEPFAPMTRASKLIFCLLYMSTASHLIAVDLGLHLYDEEAYTDYAETHWDLTFNAAIFASFCAACITHLFVVIARNSQWLPTPALHGFILTAGNDPKDRIPGEIFPMAFRIIAVNVSIFLIVCNIAILFSVGYSFGYFKSYMWLYAMFIAIAFDMFIMENIFLIIRAIFWRVILKKSDIHPFRNDMIKRKIQDEIKYATVKNKKRMVHKDQITPLPFYFRRALAHREFEFVKYRRITFELLIYGFFLLTLCFVFMVDRDTFSYHAKRTMEKMVIEDVYTSMMPFKKIASIDDIWDYFNRTFLLTLHWRPYGWCVDTNFRLIGIPRLRQVRMPRNSCVTPPELQKVYTADCVGILDEDYVEQVSYYPTWTFNNLHHNVYTNSQRLAYLYTSPEETASQSLINNFYHKPYGGYFAFLGRTATTDRDTLLFLKNNTWIDESSRLIVAEFSTFNNNAKLLTVVQLVIRITAMADIQSEYKIYTLKFAYDGKVFNSLENLMHKLFILAICLIVIYQMYLFMVTSWDEYFTVFWNYYDLIVVLFGIILASFITARATYLETVIWTVWTAKFNSYIDFVPAIAAQHLVDIFSGLLIFIVTFRLWRLLTVNHLFRASHYTLEYSAREFLKIGTILVITMLGFTTSFHYLLGPYYEFASSFHRAFLLLTSINLGLSPQLNLHLLNHQGIVTYLLQVSCFIVFRVFFVCVFMSIVLVSFSFVKRVIEREEVLKIKYWHYVIERIVCSKYLAEELRMRLRERAKRNFR